MRRNIRIVMSGTYAERKYGTPEWLTNHHKGLRHFEEKALKKFAEAETAYSDAKAHVDRDRAQSDESKRVLEEALRSANVRKELLQENLNWQKEKSHK